jgi:hypothetical protein
LTTPTLTGSKLRRAVTTLAGVLPQEEFETKRGCSPYG